jgi:hypothetical protein
MPARLLKNAAAVYGAEQDSIKRDSKVHLSRLGAVFPSGEQARVAAQRLCRETGISPHRIRVLEPNDPGLVRKLCRSRRADGILSPCPRLAIGAAGALLGTLLALAFAFSGVAQHGWAAALVFSLLGLAAGHLFGGLATAGPDQAAVIAWIKSAARGGRWFVLVHISNFDEQRRVRVSLLGMSPRVSGFF